MSKIIIELQENNLARIIEKNQTGNKIKTISIKELYEIFKASCELKNPEEDYFKTPILPNFEGISTLQYLEQGENKIVILKMESCFQNISLYNKPYNKIGIPNLLFKINIFKNAIQKVSVVAIANTEKIIKNDTKLFNYPFSNVFHDTRICFGRNKIIDLNIKELYNLHSIPKMFLSMDNNMDMYNSNNLSELDYRTLLSKLYDKPFPDQWLKPLGINYEKWLSII